MLLKHQSSFARPPWRAFLDFSFFWCERCSGEHAFACVLTDECFCFWGLESKGWGCKVEWSTDFWFYRCYRFLSTKAVPVPISTSHRREYHFPPARGALLLQSFPVLVGVKCDLALICASLAEAEFKHFLVIFWFVLSGLLFIHLAHFPVY